MTTKKDIEKHKLLNKLIESSESGEDKLIAARVVANEDSQKATNAIKSLMNKKWPRKQKYILAVFVIFCLVLAGLRVYAIVVRNESIADMVQWYEWGRKSNIMSTSQIALLVVFIVIIGAGIFYLMMQLLLCP